MGTVKKKTKLLLIQKTVTRGWLSSSSSKQIYLYKNIILWIRHFQLILYWRVLSAARNNCSWFIQKHSKKTSC